MKFSTILSLFLAVCLLATGSLVLAQDSSEPPAGEAETAAATPEITVEEQLEWSDYSVKAYTLTFWGGNASGATYLENMPLEEQTVLTDGAGEIRAYDGGILHESRSPDYDGATKEFTSGDSFGGRIGIYIADDFHLDMIGSYAAGEAVTSMVYTNPDTPNKSERVVVDTDPGFKSYKGGLALMYNANSASFFGIVPRLGFGLGGVINRFTELEDKTALYLEGNFGLSYEVIENFELAAQVDLTTYGFEVDELGYSNMINYTTYSLGITWFIDRVPEGVRAAHMVED